MRGITTIFLLSVFGTWSGQSKQLQQYLTIQRITFEEDGDGHITGLEADARGQLRHFIKK